MLLNSNESGLKSSFSSENVTEAILIPLQKSDGNMLSICLERRPIIPMVVNNIAKFRMG